MGNLEQKNLLTKTCTGKLIVEVNTAISCQVLGDFRFCIRTFRNREWKVRQKLRWRMHQAGKRHRKFQALFISPLRMPDLPDLPGDPGHPKLSLVDYLLESANYQRELGVVWRQLLSPYDLYTCCALCLALTVPSLYLQISSSRSVMCHLLQEAFLDLMHGS